jgi:predicted  nucleic acid-binding Zn-ribbon protein
MSKKKEKLLEEELKISKLRLETKQETIDGLMEDVTRQSDEIKQLKEQLAQQKQDTEAALAGFGGRINFIGLTKDEKHKLMETWDK